MSGNTGTFMELELQGSFDLLLPQDHALVECNAVWHHGPELGVRFCSGFTHY